MYYINRIPFVHGWLSIVYIHIMEKYRGMKIQNLINKYYVKKSPPFVLDVGCGKNNDFFKFSKYVGVDINSYKGRKNIVVQDLNSDNQLHFKDQSFDIVICTEFLEHLFRPDMMAVEINRVVKKDGLIIVSLPNEFTLNCRLGVFFNKVRNEGFNLYSHKYIFNKDKIQEFIDEYFDVHERAYACLGIGLDHLPDKIKDLLANLSPSLFAKSVIYACKPRNEAKLS